MMKFGFALLAAIGLAACGGSGGSGTYEDPVRQIPLVTFEDQSFGEILNNLRIDNGGQGVTYDSRLDAAAQGHADDMLDRNYFSHESPEGEDVHDRIVAQGYNPIAWGENIAWRQTSEASVLDGWRNSSQHNAMMNAQSLEEFGLGRAGSGRDTRWVLVMATEG